MQLLRTGLLAVLPLAFVASGLAQSSAAQEAPQQPPAQETPQAAPTQEAPQAAPSEEDSAPPRSVRTRPLVVNCWRQAGIASDLINKQWKIQDEGKARIAAACNELSTSAQQKRELIVRIDSDTEKAIAKLIPAQQLQAYKACKAAEEKKHPKPATEKELGPCGGEMSSDSPHDHH